MSDSIDDKIEEIETELGEEFDGKEGFEEVELDRVATNDKYHLTYLFRNDGFGIRYKVKGELILTNLFFDSIHLMYLN